LDDYVAEVKINAMGADKEINLAQKNSRDVTRKIICLVFIISFLIISLGLIVYFLI
jgi:hypothetical protein